MFKFGIGETLASLLVGYIKRDGSAQLPSLLVLTYAYVTVYSTCYFNSPSFIASLGYIIGQ